MEETSVISKQNSGRREESTRGCCGNAATPPHVREEAECFGCFSQRVVFDFEQCRYVFPVGTEDIHLKIGFFFSPLSFDFKIKNVPL